MISNFSGSFKSEWLKQKKSPAIWLTIAGGFLIPLIMLAARFQDYSSIAAANNDPKIWEILYSRCWQYMGLLLLPMGVILTASLITQVEIRNNTWKQVHASPQSYLIIYLSKLSVMLMMLLVCFLLFNLGIWLCAAVPVLIPGVAYPKAGFPMLQWLQGNAKFFLACLPILAFQFLLGMQFRNFVVPIGLGFALYVGSMVATGWKHGYLLPYIYCAMNFSSQHKNVRPPLSIHWLAAGYFVIFSVANYYLYRFKKDKT